MNTDANQTNQKIRSASERSSPTEATCTSDSCSTGAKSCEQLMSECPVTAKAAPWLACLRKPAISLSYTLEKRHVPDITASSNQPNAGQDGGKSSALSGSKGTSQGDSQGTCGCRCSSGVNSDVMQCTGSCTIRYFDLLMGAMGLVALGAIWRLIRR